MINLDTLTAAELRALRDAIPQAIKAAEAREREAIRAELERITSAKGYKLSDIARRPRAKAKSAPAAAKRGPGRPKKHANGHATA